MEGINVCLQFKPSKEDETNFQKNSNSISNIKTGDKFSFDNIFQTTTTNEEIFNSLIMNTIDNIIKGTSTNISILLYGQSSTGKESMLKGKGGNGLIALTIKDILSKLNDPLITKSSVKLSYAELFNETINDLIEPSKKNLDIQENLVRNVIINGLSETIVNDNDKLNQLLLLAEKNENKFPDRKSKTHLLFRIKIDIVKKNMRNQQNIIGYINFIKLAGSENIQKGKSDGVSMNKSIIFFKDSIYKLAKDPKCAVNLKESKLTRLLQPNFNGNIKTVIICFIVDDNEHYQENVNTLNFGTKAKCIKTSTKCVIKFPERNIDKSQLAIRRINSIQTQINQRKEKFNQNNLNKLLTTTARKKEEENHNERIASLEKELEDLKKIMSKKESFSEERQTNSLNNDHYSVNSGTLRTGLTQSEYKPTINQMPSFSTAIKPQTFNPFPSLENFPDRLTSTSTLRNACFTERGQPNNLSIHRTANTVYSIANSLTPVRNNFDFDYPMNSNLSVDYTYKENEELKRRITEMRNSYYEIVKKKDEEIRCINQNHEITMNECEKLINEANEKYLNLMQEYELTQTQLREKDETIYSLNIQSVNQETDIKNLKEEIAKVSDLNNVGVLEEKYNKLQNENNNITKEKNNEINKVYKENEKLKTLLADNQKDLDDKVKEYKKLKDQLDLLKKNSDKEIIKLRMEIKNIKNINNPKLKNNKGNSKVDKQDITEYEEKITQLKAQNDQYKEKLEKVITYQIPEYEKLLQESFDKITDLDNQLKESQEMIKTLQIASNIPKSIQKTMKNEDRSVHKSKNDLSSMDKLLGKKRKQESKTIKNYMSQSNQNVYTGSLEDISNFQI